MIIENVYQDYLENELNIPVRMELPNKPPERLIVIEKTGSGKVNFIKSSVLAFKSYAPSKYEAAVLNELVKNAVEKSIELDEICSVDLNSDYPYDDLSTKRNRYQAVFDIVHY